MEKTPQLRGALEFMRQGSIYEKLEKLEKHHGTMLAGLRTRNGIVEKPGLITEKRGICPPGFST